MDNALLVGWFNHQKEIIGDMLVHVYKNAAIGYQNEARALVIAREDELRRLEWLVGDHLYDARRLSLGILSVSQDRSDGGADLFGKHLVSPETLQRRRREVTERFDPKIEDLLLRRNEAEAEGTRTLDRYRPLFRRQATIGDVDHIQAIVAICGIDLKESLRKNVVAQHAVES